MNDVNAEDPKIMPSLYLPVPTGKMNRQIGEKFLSN